MPLGFLSERGKRRGKKKEGQLGDTSNVPPAPQYAPQAEFSNTSNTSKVSPVPLYTPPVQYAPPLPNRTQYMTPIQNPNQYPTQYTAPTQHLAPPYNIATTPSTPASNSYTNLRDTLTSQAGRSVTQLKTKTSQILDAHSKRSVQYMNQGAALCDILSSKLDAIITSIDGESFSGREQDLWVQEAPESSGWKGSDTLHPQTASRGVDGDQSDTRTVTTRSSNHFSKVWFYANSRLPPHLPPLKIYLPTWPLICLAASYSERVYSPPSNSPNPLETHIPSNWRSGTKAMYLKSLPIDDMHTVVFSIRGSATFMDWAVNSKSAPTSPQGFLDDEGNLCHSGFLYVARKMVSPVAERLKALLQEDPSRSHCSLLITGHSAGGAVAALLYAHMMSTIVSSELNYLTSFFKRVHCVTFGAPPVSLLSLQRPRDSRHRKSLFFSFVNEGDPVPRADKEFVRSLLRLYARPVPSPSYNSAMAVAGTSKINLSSSTLQTTSANASTSKLSKFSKNSSGQTSTTTVTRPSWNIPPTTLSTAGRIVVMREKHGRQSRHGQGDEEDIEAVTVDEDLLRKVVYGDPMMHMMSLYKRRVEILATRAVTVGGF